MLEQKYIDSGRRLSFQNFLFNVKIYVDKRITNITTKRGLSIAHEARGFFLIHWFFKNLFLNDSVIAFERGLRRSKFAKINRKFIKKQNNKLIVVHMLEEVSYVIKDI